MLKPYFEWEARTWEDSELIPKNCKSYDVFKETFESSKHNKLLLPR